MVGTLGQQLAEQQAQQGQGRLSRSQRKAELEEQLRKQQISQAEYDRLLKEYQNDLAEYNRQLAEYNKQKEIEEQGNLALQRWSSKIQHEHINVYAIDRKLVVTKLRRIGIPEKDIEYIIQVTEPTFRVYGRPSIQYINVPSKTQPYLTSKQRQIQTYGQIRASGLSTEETKNIMAGKITFEQAKKLSPEIRKSIGIDEWYEKEKRKEEIDTTLKLGEKEEGKPAVITGIVTPFTEKQKALSRMYEPTLQSKFWTWIKKTFIREQTAPKLEWEKTTTAPIGMGERGTVLTTITTTPESSLYFTQITERGKKLQKEADIRFEDYEKKVNELPEITQAKVNVLKSEQQKTFNEKMAVIDKEFEEKYIAGMEEIKREKKWGTEKVFPFVTTARKVWYKTEEKEKKLGKAKELFKPLTEEERLQEFTKLERRFKIFYGEKAGSTIAREIIYTKQTGRGLMQGGYTALIEHPYTFALKTGAWATAIGGATIISSYTGGLGGIATAPIMKWAGLGLLGLYGGTIVVRTAVSPTAYERGKTLGTIGVSEVTPMIVGGVSGAYLGTKAIAGIDYAYYKWLKKYPYRTAYKITEMEQLTGKKRFTTISPFDKKAQLKAFKRLDWAYLTPDERAMLKKGIKLKIVGTHATSGRFAFRKDQTMIKTEGREINAMSIANKRWSINFFDINKKASYSLYSGQAIPTGSVPLGLRIETQGLKKIPSGYKPKLTLKELQKILGTKIKPQYFKQTAYIYEKGQFGTGYVAGLKAEVEAYLKGFGTLERTPKTAYYTRIAKESFYQKLEGFMRKGYPEYALRVQKFAIFKPSTWIDKLLMRKIGTFKPMARGRVVPLQRFEALRIGDENLAKQIRNLLISKKPRAEVIEILRQKQVMDVSKAITSSSRISQFKISATYPSSYAIQLYSFLSKPSRAKYPSISYVKSYKYSAPSSLKSTISSAISGYKRSSFISSALSSIKYSYLKSLLYSMPSYPKPIKYYYPKPIGRGEQIKKLLRKKFKPTPEITGLFPDFTARALGLAPKEVSVKQALREMAKIQTGLELRTGARIKGYSPIDERQLMAKIMK